MAKVYGVVTFYSQFSLKKKGKYKINVCMGCLLYTSLDAMNVAEGAPLRMCNAIVPILTFIIVTLLAIWYTGGGLKEPLSIAGIQNAFGNSDSASSILYAVLFTSVVSIGMAAAQRIMSLKECIEAVSYTHLHPLKKTWVYIGETGASIQKWTN